MKNTDGQKRKNADQIIITAADVLSAYDRIEEEYRNMIIEQNYYDIQIQKAYNKHYSHVYNAHMNGTANGIKAGIEKVAGTLLKNNMPTKQVAVCTGMSIDEVRKLRRSMKDALSGTNSPSMNILDIQNEQDTEKVFMSTELQRTVHDLLERARRDRKAQQDYLERKVEEAIEQEDKKMYMQRKHAYEDGIEHGTEKGIEKVARNLLLISMPVDQIADLTGLSIDRLMTMQKRIEDVLSGRKNTAMYDMNIQESIDDTEDESLCIHGTYPSEAEDQLEKDRLEIRIREEYHAMSLEESQRYLREEAAKYKIK